MKKWNLVIDISLCTNCSNCVVATNDEYLDNAHGGYSAPGGVGINTIHVERRVRGEGGMVDVHYIPKMCNHCDNAPCMKTAGGAVTKRADGIVIVDPDKAKGRHDIVDSCPFGSIIWNDAENVPQNWIFDAHLLDNGWKEPRGAHACPTRAMSALYVTDEQMVALAGEQKLQTLRPELKTKPRVYYKNLDTAMSHFIGGNVSGRKKDKVENVVDAEVTLSCSGKRLQTCRTDAFGDFRFDGLAPESSDYALDVVHSGYRQQHIDVQGKLGGSRNCAVLLETA